MQKVMEPVIFEWSKNQTAKPSRRGIATLVTPQINLNAPELIKPKARCIWPTALQNTDSRYLSRRVWSR